MSEINRLNHTGEAIATPAITSANSSGQRFQQLIAQTLPADSDAESWGDTVDILKSTDYVENGQLTAEGETQVRKLQQELHTRYSMQIPLDLAAQRLLANTLTSEYAQTPNQNLYQQAQAAETRFDNHLAPLRLQHQLQSQLDDLNLSEAQLLEGTYTNDGITLPLSVLEAAVSGDPVARLTLLNKAAAQRLQQTAPAAEPVTAQQSTEIQTAEQHLETVNGFLAKIPEADQQRWTQGLQASDLSLEDYLVQRVSQGVALNQQSIDQEITQMPAVKPVEVTEIRVLHQREQYSIPNIMHEGSNMSALDVLFESFNATPDSSAFHVRFEDAEGTELGGFQTYWHRGAAAVSGSLYMGLDGEVLPTRIEMIKNDASQTKRTSLAPMLRLSNGTEVTMRKFLEQKNADGQPLISRILVSNGSAEFFELPTNADVVEFEATFERLNALEKPDPIADILNGLPREQASLSILRTDNYWGSLGDLQQMLLGKHLAEHTGAPPKFIKEYSETSARTPWAYRIGAPLNMVIADGQSPNVMGVGSSGTTLDWMNRGTELVEADFSNRNLNSARFMNSDITDANFMQAILTRADLFGVIAQNTNFRGANLERASLSEATLTSTNFENANLQGANMSQSNMQDADLNSANLTSANLSGVNLMNADLHDASLQGAILSFANLNAANLTSAYMQGAQLAHTTLDHANLTEANLVAAYMPATRLHGANFVEADLTGAYLAGADLSNANLTSATLLSVNLSNANLGGASLVGAKLQGANLTGVDLRQTNLSNVEHDQTTEWDGARLTTPQIQSLGLNTAPLAADNMSSEGGSSPVNQTAPDIEPNGSIAPPTVDNSGTQSNGPQLNSQNNPGTSGFGVNNTLKPFNTPNGLVGNNGSQTGHGNNGNRGNTRTAVADDPQEPNKPFQVIGGQVVVGDNVLLPELDLSRGMPQSGDRVFGVPVGLAGLPEYTPAPRSDATPATQQNIPVADTSSQSTQPSARREGGVTWGGDLGNDKGKTAAELGLDPNGKLPGPEKTKAPDPIPGYGEGVNTQDLNQNNTRDWGGGPVTPDLAKLTPEGFPQKDETLEKTLNPEGPAGARFRFPPANEEIPAAEYQAVIKTLPALQQVSVAEYSQLSSADQKNIISRAVEYQSLPADIKANTSLLQYADSGQTSASQRSQMLGEQQRQTVHTAQQILSSAQSGLSNSTIELIDARINVLQQNTAALNQQTQVLTQSNANRQSTLATTTADPVTAAFIKPDIKPDQTPPASNSIATPQINSQASPIPRFMVIRTANGPQLMENLPNGKTQMLPYPIPADTPVTRQASNGSWSGVPDAYAIGAKNLLDTLFLQSTVKMLNGGNAVQAPGAQNAAPQAPTSLPQPAF